MTMISLTPTCATMLAVIRRCGPPLLVLPFCLLLSGCDTASSNSDQDLVTKVQSVDTLPDSEPQNIAENLHSTLAPETNAGDQLTESSEGQSLIAAAQSSSDGPAATTSDLAASSSALQATLMGDYGGVVPCTDCDSIDVLLNLFSDGSVTKTSTYQNPAQPRVPVLESGVYRQDQNKITIVYEDGRLESYYIQDNHLILIDEQDVPNDDYTLARQ